MLVLQEDKISYVLAGKNLLSDAGAGDAIISTPEVLGTQIARTEDFGISNNPESFAEWGGDVFFTDAKRGAVLRLTGSSYQNDRLEVISEMGMGSWFRDLFNTSFDTQKLGGYDPYMGEYVLSSNDRLLPADDSCVECGFTKELTITSDNAHDVCYELGSLVGDVFIVWNVVSVSGTFNITATYDGSDTTTGDISTSGELFFDKDKVQEDTFNLNITSTDSVTLSMTVMCPQANQMKVVLVTVTSDIEDDKFVTNEYSWVDGAFVSPLHREQIDFDSGDGNVVSQFDTIEGNQGGGVIPTDSATVTMKSNTLSGDNFVFDESTDKFRYLRTNTEYTNDAASISSLLAVSSVATPITSPASGNTAYTAEFSMPASGDILYLIWDYRNTTSTDLCFGATKEDACCGCI